MEFKKPKTFNPYGEIEIHVDFGFPIVNNPGEGLLADNIIGYNPAAGPLIARELVEVQPLDLPRGEIYFIDFQYRQNSQNNSIFEFKKPKPFDEWLLGQKLNHRLVDSQLDAGYVYAPYIPLQLEPTIIDENDFQLREGILSRYTTRMVNRNNYGTIEVGG